MLMPSLTVRRCCLAAILMLGAALSASERRPITDQDLFAFVWIADPQISPDGSEIAFVRVTVDRQRDQYDSAIWAVHANGRDAPRQLTVGTRDLSPRWSPDGTHLAFIRTVERDGRPLGPQIFVMPLAGGEPRAITQMPRGATNPIWSPDGTTIAFTSTTRSEELPRDEVQFSETTRTRETDVRVITNPAYRANGVAGFGYVDADRPSHVWTVTTAADGEPLAAPRQITNGEFGVVSHAWARDASAIYFVSDRRPRAYALPDDADIYSVGKDGGEPRLVASIDGRIGAFTVSPDGRRVAFVAAANGKPERSFDQPDLWVATIDGGSATNLTASYDFDIGGGLSGDQRAPRGQHPASPVWTSNDSVIVRAGHQGSAPLVPFRVGTQSQAYSGHSPTRAEEVVSYTADAKGVRFALVLSSPTRVGDLFVVDGETGEAPRKLTTFNDELFAKVAMSAPEEIWYPSFDGKKVQGWILKPPDFDATKKYPLIVQIHGGPHAAYGHTFTHEFQWMAGRGYVVLYTNPRGSSNYGQEFGNAIQFNYPGDDYKDVMAGVDAVVKRGYVDESRMGVTGGSGGGLLTNWVVTQTNRFKAAVSQRDISDWSAFWYTADFTQFTPSWFRKAPFEDAADYARRSPITHAAKIQTPLMFILGDEDWRTPPGAGGEQLFRALKYLKRPTVMVRFPNENHELSRSGKPWHRVERLQHIIGWFDKHLLGKTLEIYDER